LIKEKQVKKILIIDDETDLCLLLKGYLVQREHQVLVANNLFDGVSKAIEMNPDVVFLDNNLPDGQGWDKAGWFQKQFPSLHIILMSAFNSAPNFLEDPLRVHILEKPVSFSMLDKTLLSVH
jgi:DNA-binding response OmpR family regulator